MTTESQYRPKGHGASRTGNEDGRVRPIANDKHPLARKASLARRRRRIVHALQAVLLIASLGAWELLSGPRDSGPPKVIDSYYVSRPSDIVGALQNWYANGDLATNVLVTALVTLLGLILGIIAGLTVGFVLGVNRMLSSVLNPFISALYSIPRLALIPLLLLWFGIGTAPKLAMVIIIVFFLVFYATYSGVRDVDQQLINVLTVMGANRFQIYSKVILQAAMMFIIAGLRIAVPYALVAAVTAEMMVGDSGLGYLVVRSAGQFYTAGVFGAIVVMMAFAMMMSGALTLFERRALHWKPDISGRGL